MIKWPKDSYVNAEFGGKNDCYRHSLTEIWNPILKVCMFLLMNPSTACLDHSDNTLCKTGKYARRWSYGGQYIANVHDYRATDNKKLLKVRNPVSKVNDQHILSMAQKSDKVILAYGFPPQPLRLRGLQVIEMLLENKIKLYYLELANDGITPKHPLYLSGDLEPIRYPHKLKKIRRLINDQ